MLETELDGVVLRELTADDVDAYYSLVDANRAHLHQHGDFGFEHAADLAAVRAYFESPWDSNVRLGIWLGDRLVGRVDLNPVDPPKWVLGYWIGSAWTGRGIVTASCRAAIAHAGSALDATEIYAGVTDGNGASVAVLRRLGFDHLQDVDGRSRWRLPLVDEPPPPHLI